ncbi:MAG: Dehydrogenase [Marmoricola sp.]|nr:Dehydrogenase [Marmoricola sp.]
MLGGQGPYVGQLVIGGAIVEGEKDKDPDVLAHRIFALHTERDRFRDQVSEDWGLATQAVARSSRTVAQAMSAGLLTSSSVLRSAAVPVASSAA